jgi:peptidoglycan-associated lipoprotein
VSTAPGAARALIGALLAVGLLTGCPPAYPKCDNDRDCKPNEFCVKNECQQCRTKADCKKGEICNNGRCESISTRCTDDAQCPEGQSCIDGACKACASDTDCGEFGKCNQGRCDRDAKRQSTEDPDANANAAPAAGPCTLEPIFFDFNEAELSSEASGAIERNAVCLRKAGSRAISLAGHTDPRGTEEYNLTLSERRAQMVRDRLTRLGIESSRLRLVPKGELDATGTDEAGWAKDRRVDLSW